MKARTKMSVFSAAVALGLAALTLSYAGYAWFTMGRTVQAQGINLSVTAPNDLEISLNGVDGWTQDVTINTTDIVKKMYPAFDTATDSFYLLPASSLAGFNDSVFYTKRAQANGQAYPDTVFLKGSTIAKGATAYEGTYIDVPLYFRTASNVAGGFDLALDFETTAQKAGSYVRPLPGQTNDLYKIARAAFLSPDGTKNAMGETTPLVLAPVDHGVTTGVITSSVVPGGAPTAPTYLTADRAVNFLSEPVIHIDPATYEGDAPTYHPVQMTVRIWIEGQDSKCLVTVGGKTFEMGLTFTRVI